MIFMPSGYIYISIISFIPEYYIYAIAIICFKNYSCIRSIQLFTETWIYKLRIDNDDANNIGKIVTSNALTVNILGFILLLLKYNWLIWNYTKFSLFLHFLTLFLSKP